MKRIFGGKIVYYLGAGASANSIPTVGDISYRLDHLYSFLFNNSNSIIGISTSNGIVDREKYDVFLGIIKKWNLLVKQTPSIDTLAKRLFDQRKDIEYKEYKLFLTVLMNFFHCIKKNKEGITEINNLEGRYENLLRSINQSSTLVPNGKKIIPNNFEFISWNYDFQLDLSSQLDDLNLLNENNIVLKKLNGSSLVVDIKPPNLLDVSESIIVQYLFRLYEHFHYNNQLNIPLKFSWEPNDFDFLYELACKTDYVVVIGYSFPTFNRVIDNLFFQSLRKNTIVYTQGYNYQDSERIEKYLNQTFSSNKPIFTTIPVESPFFFVPPVYFES
ncbi:hypothetical protein [Lacihabitans soyangensis]|uniref:SIR2-like domain-containing protein n=1 Tax=Lacihabitans soyangensis TaxID=869394 RepID=A0AAE3KUT5_9BACT|nr:hypothetical protein [Lacihabitans soyangensis]MCP9765937.1 hypothetical protein [Lacihabitans soyangensis]